MKINSNIALSAFLCAGAATAAHAQNTAPLPISNADQVATDDLGRALPTYAQVGAPKPNRVVGMFYWEWHGDDRWLPNAQYDLTKYLATRPYFKDFTAHTPGAPDFPTFYWAEPIFGYYRSTDPWVIRKQLMMLADTGVDFLFLDYTNGSLYEPELQAFMDVARDLKNNGVAVPKLTFFLNSEPEWKVYDLYNRWYKKTEYKDMWFQWKGKPLLMSPLITDGTKLREGQDAALLPEIQQYFTFRPTWAFHDAAKEPTKWRFIHGYNAPVAVDEDGKPEQLVVNKSTGGPIWQNLADGGVSAVEGKTYTEKDYAPDWTLPDANKGVFFQTMWDRALEVAPPMLLVTGWNEWRASVWNTPGVVMLGRTTGEGQGHIVDEFNQQFNRDLEPMKGGYGDDYYWQFVANMRRYKGMQAPAQASAPRTINSFASWSAVQPNFADTISDIAKRDFVAGVPDIRYVNDSARNDIVSSKVAYNKDNIYFYVRTRAALSSSDGANWMQLFVDADQNPKTGWHGYDYRINGAPRGDGTTTIEANVGGKYEWDAAQKISYATSENELQITVPRGLLKLDKAPVKLDFKWADNAFSDAPDVMDFYSYGDVAPNERFNYRYDGE